MNYDPLRGPTLAHIDQLVEEIYSDANLFDIFAKEEPRFVRWLFSDEEALSSLVSRLMMIERVVIEQWVAEYRKSGVLPNFGSGMRP